MPKEPVKTRYGNINDILAKRICLLPQNESTAATSNVRCLIHSASDISEEQGGLSGLTKPTKNVSDPAPPRYCTLTTTKVCTIKSPTKDATVISRVLLKFLSSQLRLSRAPPYH